MSAGERLCIQGGRVIDPANGIDAIADVFIADGRVVAVGKRRDDFTVEREFAVPGQCVCPGLVDLGARLREPGLEHKATIASETTAAASAGITTLCCPPDTDPVIETPADVELIRHRAERVGKARVLPLGALTQSLEGKHLTEMAALKQAGCVGLSNAQHPLSDTLVARRALEYAATFDIPVFLHPEDPWLRNGGCAHEGAVSTRLGLPGIPDTAETVAVARDLELIQQTGVRAHFCRLSTARAVHMVARAHREGLPVSADTNAHQLHLTEIDVGDFSANCHVIPPLRTQRDRDALRAGLAEGTIAAICSDHQPHEDDAKQAPFPATEPGISALETLLPLALRLAEDGTLALTDVIACLTCQSADILSLEAGRLSPGVPADICVFDPQCYWTLTATTLVSRGHNSPFLGWELKGRVTHTFLGGKLVFERI